MLCRLIPLVLFSCSGCSYAAEGVRRLDSTEDTTRTADALLVELREIARSKIPVGSRLRCLPDSVNFEHLLDEMSSDELTIRAVESLTSW